MKWGLALGGGALKGAAHVGVLECLLRAGLAPDVLVGTSAGSLVAAMAAGGMTPREMAEAAAELTADTLLDIRANALSLAYIGSRTMLEVLGVRSRFLRPTPNGLAPGRKLLDWIRRTLPERDPDRLRQSFAAVATDLHTGEMVLLGSARHLPLVAEPGVAAVVARDLAAAVRASSSIPWLYAPARLAGRMLVDGAVVSPVPAYAARLLGADVVVAVDLGRDDGEPEEVRGIARTLNRAIDVAMRRLSDFELRLYADLVIQPAVGRVPFTDVRQIPELVRLGREAAERALPAVEALIRRTAPPRTSTGTSP
ncbi:MAG: patatin-like phospholipase family protein [Clostridia bacterium]|nr:patatin-like phospholipase family protein [Clostridia bacterium]